MKIGELVAPMVVARPQSTRAASTTTEPTPTAPSAGQAGMAQEDRMLRRVALDQMFQEYKGLQNPGRKVEGREERPRRRRGRKWVRRLARDLRRHADPEGEAPPLSLLLILRRARQAVRRLGRRLEKKPQSFRKVTRAAVELLEPVQRLLFMQPSQEGATGSIEDRQAELLFSLVAAADQGRTQAEMEEARRLWAEGRSLLELTLPRLGPRSRLGKRGLRLFPGDEPDRFVPEETG